MPMEKQKSLYVCTADYDSKRRRYVVYRIKLAELFERHASLQRLAELQSQPMDTIVTEPMLFPRFHMGCGVFGSRIVFGGGCLPSSSKLRHKGHLWFPRCSRTELYVFEMDSTVDPHPNIKPNMMPNFSSGKLQPMMFEFEGRLFALGTSMSNFCDSLAFEVFNPNENRWLRLPDHPLMQSLDPSGLDQLRDPYAPKPLAGYNEDDFYFSYALLENMLWVSSSVYSEVYMFNLKLSEFATTEWGQPPFAVEKFWPTIRGIPPGILGRGRALYVRVSPTPKGMLFNFAWNESARKWEIMMHRLTPQGCGISETWLEKESDDHHYAAVEGVPHLVWQCPDDGDQFTRNITHSLVDLGERKICCVLAKFDSTGVKQKQWGAVRIDVDNEPSKWWAARTWGQPWGPVRTNVGSETPKLRIHVISFKIVGDEYTSMSTEILNSRVFEPDWSPDSAGVLNGSVLHSFVR
ncbi:uncharacterized protein LOC133718839 [Rosa rugosa]|uniref:uncharacterized protein LOC133718839 n=1 Tax=Rosa rugosa TaxID=74645 RepID=UPI002B401C8A|nr:uncharacterized protein LOC133718839 [Rosa rugosa]